MKNIHVTDIDCFLNRFNKPAVLTSYDYNIPVIISCNKAHVEMTGYSALELVGKSPSMFKGPLSCPDTSKELKQALKDYDFWYGTLTNYKKNGDAYQFELTIVGVLIDGRKYYFALKNAL